VLELVRRRRLTEEYSFIWILMSGALIALSVGRRMVDALALRLGIFYGPALLLLILGFFVAVAALHFSLVISRQRRQIERLIEDVALLDARQRRERDVASPGQHRVSSQSQERLASQISERR
jgi:NO-binding membrane sensor protein with MHYT domain